MPRILCNRPNASEEINGVKFEPVDDGMLSEEVSEDVAAAFLEIPGYAIHGDAPAPKPPADDAEKEALIARAAAIGFDIKRNWGLERLRKEVEDAEAKKAEAPAGE